MKNSSHISWDRTSDLPQYLEDRTKTTQSWPSINHIQPVMQPITFWLGYGRRPKNRDLFSGTGEGIFISSIAFQTGLWVHAAYDYKGSGPPPPWDKAAVASGLSLASIQGLSWRTSGVTNPLSLSDILASTRTFTEHEMSQNLFLEVNL